MLDEMVDIPQLLATAGLVRTRAIGQKAVAHGEVYIERWNISISEIRLPRWVLRGVTIHVGDKAVRISDCGYKIRRDAPLSLA